jgi:hypothetical protein
MKVLVAPAHYFFSDKFGSEPGWAYQLVLNISTRVSQLDVIVGFLDCDTSVFPKNVKFYSIYSSRSKNALLELLKYLFFYPLMTVKAVMLLKNQYDVVHHMFPLSQYTINPLVLILKILQSNSKIILGPLQLPQTLSGSNDLDVMLTGKSRGNISSLLAKAIFSIATRIAKCISIYVFKSADQVICNSEQARKYYQGMWNGVTIQSIPIGINLPKIISTNINNLIILSVGQLSERKGQIYLLQAFKNILHKIPSAKLIIAGDGEDSAVLKEFCIKNNIEDHVEFKGRLEKSNLVTEYERAAIFCLPSLSDPSPSVVLEAMSYGLPIVATNVGSVAEMVGNAGLLIPASDSVRMEKAILEIWSNKTMLQTKKINATSRIEKVYSWKEITKKWVKLYEQK